MADEIYEIDRIEDCVIHVRAGPTLRASSSAPSLCQAVDCGRSAVNMCTGCRSAHYCSSDCQRSHWKLHKTACKLLQREPPRQPDSLPTEAHLTEFFTLELELEKIELEIETLRVAYRADELLSLRREYLKRQQRMQEIYPTDAIALSVAGTYYNIAKTCHELGTFDGLSSAVTYLDACEAALKPLSHHLEHNEFSDDMKAILREYLAHIPSLQRDLCASLKPTNSSKLLRYCIEAVRAIEFYYGHRHVFVIQPLVRHANICRSRLQVKVALEQLQRAYSVSSKRGFIKDQEQRVFFDALHVALVCEMAHTLMDMHHIGEAERFAEEAQALCIDEKTRGTTSPSNAMCHALFTRLYESKMS